MKTINLKFEKTKSGNLINDIFYVKFVSINGLNVVCVQPTHFVVSKYINSEVFQCSFYFKDLTSALNFCSRFHVPHEYEFWVKRAHYLTSYRFWYHFSSTMSFHSKRILNSLNHE